jgi:hypothetical protein
MSLNMNKITRADKSRITLKLHDNLLDREKRGPAEPGLDAFLPELASTRAPPPSKT